MTNELNEYFKTHNMFRKSNYNIGEFIQHIESPNCEFMCKYMPGTTYNPIDKSCKCVTGFKNLTTYPTGIKACSENITPEETHIGLGTFGSGWQDQESDDIHTAVCPYGMSRVQVGKEGDRYKYSYRCNEYPIDWTTSNKGPFRFHLDYNNPNNFKKMCPTTDWALTDAPYLSKFYLEPEQNHILRGTCAKPTEIMLSGAKQVQEMPMYEGPRSALKLDCSQIPGAIITETQFVASNNNNPDQPWKAKYNCTYYR